MIALRDRIAKLAEEYALAYMGRLGREAPTGPFLGYRDGFRAGATPYAELLVEARGFVRHKPECRMNDLPNCTCGLSALLTKITDLTGNT